MAAIRNKEYALDANAIDDDWTASTTTAPFEIIDVVVNFNAAPTTSENFVIKSITAGSNTIVEDTFDPSLSSAISHVRRLDKVFPAGTTIGLDYTNTDTKNIIRVIRYREITTG